MKKREFDKTKTTEHILRNVKRKKVIGICLVILILLLSLGLISAMGFSNWLRNMFDIKEENELNGELANLILPQDSISYWKFDENADDEIENNDGTLMGDAVIVNDAERGNVLSLDGDGDYVDLGNSSSLDIINELTISAWIKPAALDQIKVGIVDKTQTYRLMFSSEETFIFNYKNESGSFPSYINEFGNRRPRYATTVAVNLDEWYHVVAVKNADSFSIYLNGVLQDVAPNYGDIIINPTWNLEIGRRDTFRYFNGSIDDVMIYNRGLTNKEILSIYQSQKFRAPLTCLEQNGYVCSATEYCSGNNLATSDSGRCCDEACVVPSWNNCNECGTGLFNLCDLSECQSILEGCYFVDNFLIDDCNSCTGASCGDYDGDQDDCNNDVCGFGNCEWDEGSCVEVISSDCPKGAICYYVDSSNGDDANDGLSETNPWKTIAKINSITLNSGDYVLFKRGETWREQLSVSSSGSEGNPITFGAYGIGEKPILHGGKLVNLSDWVDEGGGVYSYDYTGDNPMYPNYFDFLTEDSIIPTYASDASLNDGNWYYDDNNLVYYRPSSGNLENHEVDVVVRENIIRIYDQNYITIKDIHFVAGKSAVKNYARKGIKDINGMKILNSDFDYCWGGIRIFFNDKIPRDGYNNEVRGNTFNRCGESIDFSAFSAIGKFYNTTIKNNTILNTGYANGNQYWSDFMVVEMEAIGLQNTNNGDISENRIIGGASSGGIVLWTNKDSKSDNNLFLRNYLKNLTGFGINLGGEGSNNSRNNTMAYNLIINTGIGSTVVSRPHGYGGIRFNREQYPPNKIYNNVLVGNDMNLYSDGSTKYGIVKNNIFYNPDKYQLSWYGIQEMVFDNNLYYANNGKNLFRFQGDFEDWKTASGQDVNSLDSDPLFVDAANYDFRLKPGSPAINAGVDVDLTEDFEGNAIVGNPDIGAYEYT